jgi:hypothetical protein
VGSIGFVHCLRCEVQGSWKVYLISSLLACVVSAATAVITVFLLGSGPGTFSGVVTQEGVAEVPWGADFEVFYRTPFANPPALTFPEGLGDTRCHVTDQKAGSFKLQREKSGFAGEPTIVKLKWKAEGQPAK